MGDKIIPQIGQYTKVQTVSFMTMKLKSNIEWAKRACLVIYDQQTYREKLTHVSNGKNNWGFNRNDAPLLTHLAAKLKQNRLTQEDAQVLLIKMPKYARQLICLSFDKDQGVSLLKHLDLYFKNQKTKVPF